MEKRIQTVTAFAFLILCVSASAFALKQTFWPEGPTILVPPGARTSPPPPPSMYQPGEKIEFPGVDFAQSSRTVVLVVRKGCRFCDESMPFYQRLGSNAAVSSRSRIVIVAPDDEATTKEELAKYGVRVDQVVQLALSRLKVRGTPTAVVVNRSGVVERVFTGKLEEDREQQLVAALSSAP